MSENSNIQSKSSQLNEYILTFFFPLLGLLYSVFNWRRDNAKNIFWIACVYMSFIHIFLPDGQEFGTGADIGRYVIQLQELFSNGVSYAQAFALNPRLDIYQMTVTYIVSRFTDNGHVLFLVFGIVFGYFYSRNIWFVLSKVPNVKSGYISILVALLFLVCPIWNVSGVRMWTALHMFVYGALHYFLEGDKKKIIWTLLSVTIHYTFVIPIIIFVAYVLLPNQIKKSNIILNSIFLIFILTFIVDILDFSAVAKYIEQYVPTDIYNDNIAGYLGEEYVSRINDEAEAKSTLFKIASFIEKALYIVTATVSFLMIKREHVNNERSVFVFSLLLYSIGNILSIVPSGGRFVIVAQLFLLSAVVLIFSKNIFRINALIKLILSVMIVLIIFKIRIGLECYGLNLIFGNFISAAFIETNTPIISFISEL
jgi:hypothetical protein